MGRPSQIFSLLCLTAAAACGGGGDGSSTSAANGSSDAASSSEEDGGAVSPPPTTLIAFSDATKADCPAGGKKIESGKDDGEGKGTAGDGILQPGEVDDTAFVCNGQNGSEGHDGGTVTPGGGPVGHAGLVSVSDVSATDCPAGGKKIESGTDDGAGKGTADDGILQPGEVDDTAVICGGETGAAGGSPHAPLVAVVDASATDCPFGGKEITSGIDDGTGNGVADDGKLQSGEVDATSFVCNGGEGGSSLVAVSDALVGQCPAGGKKIETGEDDGAGQGTAGDGILDADEVDSTSLLCNGEDAPTPIVCTGAWEVLRWDGSQYACIDLHDTGLSGGQAIGLEVPDAWGHAWDGAERPAATYSVAKAACEAAGGRLPSVTELYRGSFVGGNGELGNSADWLWAIIRYDANARHIVVRMSDSTVSYSDDSTVRAYRCVWPNRQVQQFDGNKCYGPPGDECWKGAAEGGHEDFDKYERPPLPWWVAVRECGFWNARLATSLALTEAVRSGLPNGVSWIWTADHDGYYPVTDQFLAGLVKWTGTGTAAFTGYYSTEGTWDWITGAQWNPFRCTGPDVYVAPNPAPVTGEWVEPGTQLKTTDTDQAAATLTAAIQGCRNQGGHVPLPRDITQLVQSGLVGGSNNWLWTANPMAGNSGTDAYTGVSRWTGVDLGFTDTYSTYATWGTRNGSAAYRCVFYPVDADYLGPNPSDCMGGGCYTHTVTLGGQDFTMWADSFDRSPTIGYADAVGSCYAVGGHLASYRDYVELITSGLPNGSNNWVWTSGTTRYNYAHGVRWNGTEAAWTDTPSTNAASLLRDATARPYRCVWSNELMR